MKTIKIFIVLLVSILFSNSIVYGISLKLRVVFEHFMPDDVWLRGMDDYSWSFLPLVNKGNGNFEIERQLAQGVNYEFSVCYTHPLYYQGVILYINTREGIEYSKVYMNDQLINSSFLVDNLNIQYPGANFMFTINSNGLVNPAMVPQRLKVNDRIPPEVHYKHDTTFYSTAPFNLPLVNAWIVVLSDNNYIMPDQLFLDYIRLFAITQNGDVLIGSQEYNEYDPIFDGGLYVRFPYFPEEVNMVSDPMPGIINNGMLIINPSTARDKVWHSWTKGFAQVTPQHLGYRMEARYKASGKIAIQGGIDFVPGDWASRTEAGQGDWKFETNNVWDTVSYSSYQLPVSNKLSDSTEDFCNYWIRNHTLYIPNTYRAEPVLIRLFSLDGRLLKEVNISENTPNNPWIEIQLPESNALLIVEVISKSNKCSYKLYTAD
ncbi:MAG: hypothetical protein FD170_3852 [Bacteroidetes bacterium]|nr:MAG: hypothetical protein FD170_3852 [Bacteroidota bacterium]